MSGPSLGLMGEDSNSKVGDRSKTLRGKGSQKLICM